MCTLCLHARLHECVYACVCILCMCVCICMIFTYLVSFVSNKPDVCDLDNGILYTVCLSLCCVGFNVKQSFVLCFI